MNEKKKSKKEEIAILKENKVNSLTRAGIWNEKVKEARVLKTKVRNWIDNTNELNYGFQKRIKLHMQTVRS